MGAIEIAVRIFYGTNKFKGVVAILAAIFIDRHRAPFLDKMSLIVPLYREQTTWSILINVFLLKETQIFKKSYGLIVCL